MNLNVAYSAREALKTVRVLVCVKNCLALQSNVFQRSTAHSLQQL